MSEKHVEEFAGLLSQIDSMVAKGDAMGEILVAALELDRGVSPEVRQMVAVQLKSTSSSLAAYSALAHSSLKMLRTADTLMRVNSGGGQS